MVTGGKRLKDVLPADLHARFAVHEPSTPAIQQVGTISPPHCGGFLQQPLPPKWDCLRGGFGRRDRSLAKKHHVRVEEIKIAGVSDVMEALKTLPPATENACVAASLVTFESDLPRLVDPLQAWAAVMSAYREFA